ncbi:MAG: hypothetical protein HY303_06970 [Candidatus Wallbacteria bacterium]|nr:hypothetical protein [Candidatus Wallbacteria bacterium]
MRRLTIAVIYNAEPPAVAEAPDDRASFGDLLRMIRHVARSLRSIGHRVHVVGVGHDLLAFQRKLTRIQPHVVFNQYDDAVVGASYEMRVASLVTMMGFPLTGSSPLALGITKSKYMCACLLVGAGVAIAPQPRLLETLRSVGQYAWEFPVIVRPAFEDSGLGLDTASVVTNKKTLREKVRQLLTEFRQPALAQKFLRGREFNVGIIGGNRPRVLPLAEVDYSRLPSTAQPIMSYAAKWIETSEEYRLTSVHCPATVEVVLAAKIRQVALAAFVAVGAWGYARVDMRLDGEGEPVVLEVNCNPCIDAGIGLARSAEVAGIPYPKLLDIIVRAALESHRRDVTMALPPRLVGSIALPRGRATPEP